MGSRFVFLIWINNGGASTIGHFSADHSITSGEAWTVALLAMAVFEVCGRSLIMALRRQRVLGRVCRSSPEPPGMKSSADDSGIRAQRVPRRCVRAASPS